MNDVRARAWICTLAPIGNLISNANACPFTNSSQGTTLHPANYEKKACAKKRFVKSCTFKFNTVAAIRFWIAARKRQCTFPRVRMPVVSIGIVQTVISHCKYSRKPFLEKYSVSGQSLQWQGKLLEYTQTRPCWLLLKQAFRF